MKMEINIKQFYTIGMICFSIIGLTSAFNLFRIWENLHILGRISTGAGIVFNIALVLFFRHLKNQLPDILEEDMPSDKEITNVMENLN